jgi:hypothetical protein
LIDTVDTSPKKIRNFGLMFGALGIIGAAYSVWKGGAYAVWWLGGGAAFALGGLVAKPLLRPVYVVWMKFAFVLGWINTRVILGLFFYLVMTPIGLLMRLGGNDPLERKIDPSATSYWSKKESLKPDPDRYQRLF